MCEEKVVGEVIRWVCVRCLRWMGYMERGSGMMSVRLMRWWSEKKRKGWRMWLDWIGVGNEMVFW